MTAALPQDHDAIRELAAAYALGAATAAERAQVDAHLRECEACAGELGQLTRVSGALASTVPQIDPPPALRARVLRVAGRAASDAVDRSGRHEGRAEAGRHSAPDSPAAPRTPFALSAWLAAAAALVLAAGLAWHTSTLRDQVASLEARLAEAILRAGQSEQRIARASLEARDAQTTVAILSAPDLARIDLAGQAPAPAARGRAFWSRSRGLVFTASSLPPLPAGKTYQLWVVTAQAPVSAGLLTPDAAGGVTAVVQTPADLPEPVAMAVTIEPAGGVPAPTGEKYLIGVPAVSL